MNFSESHYLAFTDTINGEFHYGWILLIITIHDLSYLRYVRLVVNEFAYNTDPGYSIIAGDTISSINPLSIVNPLLLNEPNYYPNPTSGKLNIKTTEYDKIEIINSMGKVISETKNNEIDLSQYPAGLYFIRFYCREKSITGKIIKK